MFEYIFFSSSIGQLLLYKLTPIPLPLFNRKENTAPCTICTLPVSLQKINVRRRKRTGTSRLPFSTRRNHHHLIFSVAARFSYAQAQSRMSSFQERSHGQEAVLSPRRLIFNPPHALIPDYDPRAHTCRAGAAASCPFDRPTIPSEQLDCGRRIIPTVIPSPDS